MKNYFTTVIAIILFLSHQAYAAQDLQKKSSELCEMVLGRMEQRADLIIRIAGGYHGTNRDGSIEGDPLVELSRFTLKLKADVSTRINSTLRGLGHQLKKIVLASEPGNAQRSSKTEMASLKDRLQTLTNLLKQNLSKNDFESADRIVREDIREVINAWGKCTPGVVSPLGTGSPNSLQTPQPPASK